LAVKPRFGLSTLSLFVGQHVGFSNEPMFAYLVVQRKQSFVDEFHDLESGHKEH
jgi:hypothetical protein